MPYSDGRHPWPVYGGHTRKIIPTQTHKAPKSASQTILGVTSFGEEEEEQEDAAHPSACDWLCEPNRTHTPTHRRKRRRFKALGASTKNISEHKTRRAPSWVCRGYVRGPPTWVCKVMSNPSFDPYLVPHHH